MAVFDLSFVNKKTQSGSQQYGVLVDQLEILESRLAADGKLSPGDYALLSEKAQALYSHPGLTPAQRSNIEVKIASYKSSSSKSALKDSQDTTTLNNEVQDSQRTASMLLGNNPAKFLQAQADIQQARVSQLANAIDTLDASGQDSSAHINDYNAALSSYQDTLQALDYVSSHQSGAAPTSGYVAYVTTNNQGEITNVSVEREGSQSGYLETNGLYGGLKIYGKLNRKENGKNVFLLGDQRYSGTDVVVPSADGTIKTSTLINENMQQGKPGVFTTAVAGYTDMNPASTRTQQSIRPGSYAEGSNGFIYKANTDGTYTKYVNADTTKLGITDNQIIKLPKAYENSIAQNVTQTIDTSAQPVMPEPTSFAPATTTAQTPPAAGSPGISAAARATIGAIPPGLQDKIPTGGPPAQPTSSSPSTNQNVFQKTVSSAQSFLGGLFGR